MQQSDFSELRQAVCQIVAAVPRGRPLPTGPLRALWAVPAGRGWSGVSWEAAAKPAFRPTGSSTARDGFRAVMLSAARSRMRELLESEGVQVAGDRIVGWRKVFWDPCKEIEMP